MTETQVPASLLVLGGARSGKSRYAQKFAETSGRVPFLIATAEARDAEMAARIARHVAERDAHWGVIEEALELASALSREALPERILVVDCITLWLSNLVLGEHDPAAATKALVETISGLSAPVIFVSNEVGSGIVPDNALARTFRDIQGITNQKLAEACEAVVLVTAGLALELKWPGRN
jgi:adenosylcobinamide kinase/adenosylcobinamide-phosphate guanylyltransferase